MKKYLIDVNLPYRFSHWYGEAYIHQRDIDARLQDKDIWEYAKIHELTVVTKDVDFADRIMIAQPPPKVIQFRIGNMKMRIFHQLVSDNLETICKLSDDFKLINVYSDRIEGIN